MIFDIVAIVVGAVFMFMLGYLQGNSRILCKITKSKDLQKKRDKLDVKIKKLKEDADWEINYLKKLKEEDQK